MRQALKESRDQPATVQVEYFWSGLHRGRPKMNFVIKNLAPTANQESASGNVPAAINKSKHVAKTNHFGASFYEVLLTEELDYDQRAELGDEIIAILSEVLGRTILFDSK